MKFLNPRFSKAEIEAMRRSAKTNDEDGLLASFWPYLRQWAARVPFAEDMAAAFFCVRDPQTSKRVKYTLMGALAYFVMPVDVLPDLLPLIGFSDDAAVLAFVMAQIAGSITPEHREQARAALQKEQGL
jgi:uncharacterized membrane protein YkvA (DUF1232 family)